MVDTKSAAAAATSDKPMEGGWEVLPKVAGELEVPGFSNYLQPIDATHLIGLGEASSSFGGPQLSLFDVSDIAHPKLVDVYTVNRGDWDTVSFADTDHHGVAYFPAQGILAFQVADYSYDSGQYRGSTEVVRVDVDHGFTSLGSMLHPESSPVSLRAVRFGQLLFSISDMDVLIAELTAPDTILKSIDL